MGVERWGRVILLGGIFPGGGDEQIFGWWGRFFFIFLLAGSDLIIFG